jgi:hypothetical protein
MLYDSLLYPSICIVSCANPRMLEGPKFYEVPRWPIYVSPSV